MVDTFELTSPRYGLRPYQKTAVREVLSALQEHDRVLLHAPTGAGKTRMAMSVVSMHLRQRGPTTVLWLAPTKELVVQAAQDFHAAWRSHGDVDAAVIQWRGEGERFSHGTTIRRNTMLVASLQMAERSVHSDSWIERSLQDRVSLIVFDEAHQSVAPTYRQLVEGLVSAGENKRFLLGLSATPGRANPEESRQLAAMYGERKVGVGDGANPVRYLVSKGYLADANFRTHPFQGSLNPPPSGQDYPDDVLSVLGEDDSRNRQIVEIVQKLFNQGHQRVIAFTPSVESAETCASMMNEEGHSYAAAVSGSTPRDQRTHHIENFKAPISSLGVNQVIFNCNVLTAGFDAPETSAAVIGKPTKSAVRLQQMIGRALRGPESGGSDQAEIHMLVDDTFEDFVSLSDLFCQWDRLWDSTSD